MELIKYLFFVNYILLINSDPDVFIKLPESDYGLVFAKPYNTTQLIFEHNKSNVQVTVWEDKKIDQERCLLKIGQVIILFRFKVEGVFYFDSYPNVKYIYNKKDYTFYNEISTAENLNIYFNCYKEKIFGICFTVLLFVILFMIIGICFFRYVRLR